MNIGFEYNRAKTAIAVQFGVPYNEVESLPGYVPGAMDRTPQDAITGIVLLRQSMKAETANPVVRLFTLREANGRSKILAHPTTFREGLWIVVAGGKKDSRIHIFKDGYEITADGIPTYGKGLRGVSLALTTWDNHVTEEQLYAWQQERRENRKAA